MMDKCPHCNSNLGVYVKQTLVNIPYRMNFYGEIQDNTEMYDNAEKVIDGKMVYCQNCGKAICKLSTFEVKNILRSEI